MAGREARNGLRRHPNLPRVWVSNPIEFLSTEEVWAYLLQKPNPWGGDNRSLYKLYSNASNGECPIQIDTSTPSCGNSRFGCWTCTVVERDKASEGLLASGDERMEQLISFRETLLDYRDPAKSKRDMKRMNGNAGTGPLTMTARRELLTQLLKLQEETGLKVISEDELFLIQQFWKAARNPETAHWLFDRGFWSITNDLRVLVATDRFDEAGEETYLLKRLAGRELLRPVNSHFFPDPTCLAWHRKHHGFESV